MAQFLGDLPIGTLHRITRCAVHRPVPCARRRGWFGVAGMGVHLANDDEATDHVSVSDNSDAALLGFLRRLSRARSQQELMTIVSQGVRTLLRADGATLILRDGDYCYYA